MNSSDANQLMTIISQEAPKSEKITVNGVTKYISYILKDKPFVIIVGGSETLDLNDVAIYAKLVYDNDAVPLQEMKEVDFVRAPPIDYSGMLIIIVRIRIIFIK
jgi:hypothetical protein